MEGTMGIIAKIVIGLVALEHLYILWLEMFAWETKGRKTFKSLPQHLFKDTKSLAANQGLYNGFLSAGLFWSLIITDLTWQFNIALFFLSFIFIAGIYGGATAERGIFFKQGIPALVGIILILLQ